MSRPAFCIVFIAHSHALRSWVARKGFGVGFGIWCYKFIERSRRLENVIHANGNDYSMQARRAWVGRSVGRWAMGKSLGKGRREERKEGWKDVWKEGCVEGCYMVCIIYYSLTSQFSASAHPSKPQFSRAPTNQPTNLLMRSIRMERTLGSGKAVKQRSEHRARPALACGAGAEVFIV